MCNASQEDSVDVEPKAERQHQVTVPRVVGCEQPLRNLALEARKPTNRFIALS